MASRADVSGHGGPHRSRRDRGPSLRRVLRLGRDPLLGRGQAPHPLAAVFRATPEPSVRHQPRTEPEPSRKRRARPALRQPLAGNPQRAAGRTRRAADSRLRMERHSRQRKPEFRLSGAARAGCEGDHRGRLPLPPRPGVALRALPVRAPARRRRPRSRGHSRAPSAVERARRTLQDGALSRRRVQARPPVSLPASMRWRPATASC